MAERITPMGNRVLLKEEEGARMVGKLYLPDQSVEAPSRGKVIAAGADCIELKRGDVVVYGKYAGHEFEHEGQTLLLIKETEILARLV